MRFGIFGAAQAGSPRPGGGDDYPLHSRCNAARCSASRVRDVGRTGGEVERYATIGAPGSCERRVTLSPADGSTPAAVVTGSEIANGLPCAAAVLRSSFATSV
jgi:hypothetical protein